MPEYNKAISLTIRVKWKADAEHEFCDNTTDQVYNEVMRRIERCLANTVAGQVGAIPGTEKMEVVYSVSM